VFFFFLSKGCSKPLLLDRVSLEKIVNASRSSSLEISSSGGSSSIRTGYFPYLIDLEDTVDMNYSIKNYNSVR